MPGILEDEIMALGAIEIFLLISGLVLIGEGLKKVPKIGKDLESVANWLSGFGVFIGVIDIVLGILAIF